MQAQLVADQIEFVVRDSSLGRCLIAQRAAGVCAVLFGDDRASLRADLEARVPDAHVTDGGRALNAIADEVISCVESPASTLAAPLDLQGTVFQRTVWAALREIPAGSIASYTDIARTIGRPAAARAVAQACAANALAVLIPCHRVVGSDGALSGYRWGVDRKKILLEREKAEAAKLVRA